VACSLWTALIGLFVVACTGGGGGGGGGEQAAGIVKLFLGKLQVPMFDSISVNVSAADMASIHISKNSLDDNLKIEGIPQGENRTFEVKIYADNGKLAQKGEAIADIKADENITIPIIMDALVGFLRIEIPLGFTNNTGVHSGKLFLENMEFDMKFENGKGVFNTNALPLDKLLLKIKLYDKNGEPLFSGEKEITLYMISQNETIQLKSEKGSATLELEASINELTQILAMLPISISRPPQNYGELFFTEIFAYPKTSGQDFEYMEIYNSTLDTLLLSSCRVAENEGSSTSTKRLNMPSNLRVPPMEYLFFGRDSVAGADFNYKSFHLLVAGQSLGFFCGDLVIDTLTFSAKGDNPFPLEIGKVMQLPLENYKNRTLGSSWCFGFSPREDAICP
jgi:hypothetical protein